MKGIKVFAKMLDGKCRIKSLFCIGPLVAIILVVASNKESPSKDYVIPEFGSRTRADGRDIVPYQITSQQIRTFLDKIKKQQTASAMAYGHTVFREYGRLPEDYRNLLSDFFVREYVTWNRQSKRGVYHIDASQGYALYLSTDSNRGMLMESTTVGRASGPTLDISPEAIGDVDALQLMRNYVEFHNTEYSQPQDYFISTALFGKRSRFLYLTTKDPYMPFTCEFTMNNVYGGIHKKDLETITWTCRREFPKSDDPVLHKILIETFLYLHNRDQRVISSTADIPEYNKSKLGPDLEKTVRPLFSFIKRHGYSRNDTPVYVVYTYQQLSGIVRRYRFAFKNKELLHETPTCVEIARHIGDAQYLR